MTKRCENEPHYMHIAVVQLNCKGAKTILANLIPSHSYDIPVHSLQDWEQIDYDVIDVKYIHLTEIVDLIQKAQQVD